MVDSIGYRGWSIEEHGGKYTRPQYIVFTPRLEASAGLDSRKQAMTFIDAALDGHPYETALKLARKEPALATHTRPTKTTGRDF